MKIGKKKDKDKEKRKSEKGVEKNWKDEIK